MLRTIRTSYPSMCAILCGLAAHASSARADCRTQPDEPIRPIAPAPALDPQKVELGRRLFHEPRMSRDGTVSCSSCHDLSRGGADQMCLSRGIGGATGSRNAPTVFNSALAFRLFWDGRAETLEAQIDGPLQSPLEMGSTWPDVIAMISGDAELSTRFGEIYGRPAAPELVRDAIATFERSLVTPDSRFDRFLCGVKDALTDKEQEGYALFKVYGCVSCHQGVALGGNMFQKLGAMRNPTLAHQSLQGDLGRFEVTKRESDRNVFKVPSLRNVALTAPYYHDGSVNALETAVDEMGRSQLGIELDADEIELIAAFLRTLTGEYAGRPL